MASQLDLNNKSEIDGSVEESPLNALGKTGLNDIGSDTRSIALVVPADDKGALKGRAEGALIEAGWFIRATCKTTLNALSAVLRAHTVVNLRGAGTRFSGKYFVSGVRHTIDAAQHRMEVELSRNAWGA